LGTWQYAKEKKSKTLDGEKDKPTDEKKRQEAKKKL